MRHVFTLILWGLVLSNSAQKASAQEPLEIDLDQSQTYAVVVGISDYQDEGIPDLRFADKDALAFAGFLQSEAGGALDEDHLKVLINEQATVAQFAMQLDWLWEVAKENDKVIIYFSGHGDVERKSITQPGYLLCWDAPARVYLAGGSMNVRDLNDVISTISIQNKAQVILITDACRAGKLSGSEIGGAQATAANLSKQFANEIKILSCQPNEYSIEGEQWGNGRGAFSYHLLDGLNGLADANEDQTVSVKEISRYLEDKVSEEVAPENQNPMTIGSVTETLTVVDPELLANLKAGKKVEMPVFASVETRGIEDDVLAAADSNIVKMYRAFQQALEDKRFLKPENDCADYYYNTLSTEPALDRLHSYMRRNYAASLQDDAQQVMNQMLKTGLDEFVLSGKEAVDLYQEYPDYLERAAELLGSDHYMYATLQARKNLFIGTLQKEGPDARVYYRRALKWQADMPHAYMHMIWTWDETQPDSAKFYAEKALEQVPSWVVPYTRMAAYHDYYTDDVESAEEYLNKAGEIDSTSILVYYRKGTLYRKKRDYQRAEKWFLKAIQGTTEDICFPCAYNSLAAVYVDIRKFDLAEKYANKAVEMDSSLSKVHVTLGVIYAQTGRLREAELAFKKVLELGDSSVNVLTNLAGLTAQTRRLEEAISLFKQVIEIDSTKTTAYIGLASCYREIGKKEEAEYNLKRALQLDSTNSYALNNLGIMYMTEKRYHEAEETLLKTIRIDSTQAPAWVNLGEVYRETGQFEKVEQAYNNALKINVLFAHPYAHDGLGVFYMTTIKYEEAEKEFKTALSINPNHLHSTFNLVRLYLRTEQLDMADSILSTVIKNYPDLAEGFFFSALIAWSKGDKEKAWGEMEKSFELGLNEGSLGFQDIYIGSDFDEMHQDPKWKELMEKNLPDQQE